jgi:hypothetical protein
MLRDDDDRRYRRVTWALWSALVLLVTLGVVASVGRTIYVGDLGARVDPAREWLFARLRIDDPYRSERAAALASIDGKYGAHPWLILPHVILGSAFLLLAPLQFVGGIRTRHPRVHRWSGRLLLVLALLTLVPALTFGLFMPLAGRDEVIVIAVIAAFLVNAIGHGFVAIRRGDTVHHREWMIRAFAATIAISTVRLVEGVADPTLTPLGLRPEEVFVVSMTVGWILTIGVAELWIRRTRPALVSAPVAA